MVAIAKKNLSLIFLVFAAGRALDRLTLTDDRPSACAQIIAPKCLGFMEQSTYRNNVGTKTGPFSPSRTVTSAEESKLKAMGSLFTNAVAS